MAVLKIRFYSGFFYDLSVLKRARVVGSKMLLNMINQFTTQLPAQAKVCVALSGGLDSTVLLHLLCQVPALKNRLSACYVHHGLHAAASDWQAHCQQMCTALNVPFNAVKIKIPNHPKEGLEAAARALRYQALVENLTSEHAVLVSAHHQKDQAETILLNLVRGSGVKGLSGMAAQRSLHMGERTVLLYRPILNAPIEALQAYAQQHALTWVEDPSNQSPVFRRNFIRHAVLPVLKQAWPSVERTLARSGQNLQESVQLLDRLAKMDLDQAWSNHYFIDFDVFNNNPLVDWAAQKNALRWWFWHHHCLVLLAQHYEWIASVIEAQGVSENSAFSCRLPQGELRFYQKRLYYLSHEYLARPTLKLNLATALQQLGRSKAWINGVWVGLASNASEDTFAFSVAKSALLGVDRNLDNEWQTIMLIGLNAVRAQPELATQLSSHALKRFFQTHKIPVWERVQWPILVQNQRVIAVLGCGGALKTAASVNSLQSSDFLTLTLSRDERLQLPNLDCVAVNLGG